MRSKSSFFLSKNGVKNCQFIDRRRPEQGFSLIELLLVVVIIGVLAALAVPAYQEGIRASENGRAVSNLRAIHSTQALFFSQNNRFARLTEVQAILSNGLGTTNGDRVSRGTYIFEMTPLAPTDSQLSTQYTITATRTIGTNVFNKYEITESGIVRRIFPVGNPNIDQ